MPCVYVSESLTLPVATSKLPVHGSDLRLLSAAERSGIKVNTVEDRKPGFCFCPVFLKAIFPKHLGTT